MELNENARPGGVAASHHRKGHKLAVLSVRKESEKKKNTLVECILAAAVPKSTSNSYHGDHKDEKGKGDL